MRKLCIVVACGILSGCTTLQAGKNDFGSGGFGTPLALAMSEADLAAGTKMADDWAKKVEQVPQVQQVERERTLRRELAMSLMGESDLRCDRYLTSISTDRNATRGSLDVLGLALASIGGVASPNVSSNWFSAGSSLAQSSRRSLEDTIFGGREFGLIYTAIINGRARERNEFIKAVRDGEFDDFGPASILAIARSYDTRCGINYGLAQLGVAVSTPVPPPPATDAAANANAANAANQPGQRKAE